MIRIIQSSDKVSLQSLLNSRVSNQAEIAGRVAAIMDEVRQSGDNALCGFTRRFDKADLTPEQLRVSEEEIKWAYSRWIRRY
ncbi:hypothetical protein N752_07460 [Desulforamulus aquiferis]|nr:hypothetical protein N752_07460 [Desulforamulus aquiferis]